MTVVSNTSPIVALAKADHLPCFGSCTGRS